MAWPGLFCASGHSSGPLKDSPHLAHPKLDPDKPSTSKNVSCYAQVCYLIRRPLVGPGCLEAVGGRQSCGSEEQMGCAVLVAGDQTRSEEGHR